MLEGTGKFLFFKILSTSALFQIICSSCNVAATETSEMESFFNFVRALDPGNELRIDWNWNHSQQRHPCRLHWIRHGAVECSQVHLRPYGSISITRINLRNMNLSGTLDAESLCNLPNLNVLILANNQIQGNVPECIAECDSLMHLDISSNLLSGKPPVGLPKMKNLKKFNFSNNLFDRRHRMLSDSGPGSPVSNSGSSSHPKKLTILWVIVAMVIAFLLVLGFFIKLKASQSAKDSDSSNVISIGESESPLAKIVESVSELVFFVEEKERFDLEELLEATAELRRQGRRSSLYKVQLKNNATFAVKRLKKLRVSFEDFGRTMKKIGSLKHPNLLSLVGYNSSEENKLLFYRYQRNGNLLSLLENHIEGRKDFPWKLRLSIAVGISRGLKFLYQWPEDHDGEIIPHGNIKPSNILLDENLEPLISEYGFSKFMYATNTRVSSSYTAPEKCLSELADVYSFGVIMLELLTGKIATKQEKGLDLPRWVKARVREEWTGEVFDKEISKVEMYGFPLLNISLKCVSKLPQERPSISQVVEKIEEILSSKEDISSSSSKSSS